MINTLLLFSTCGNGKYTEHDFIRIEHNGPSDQLIEVIVVSIEEIPKKVEWERNYVISESIFSTIEKLVHRQMNENSLEGKKKINETYSNWAVFKITEFVSGKAKVYQLTSQEISVKFFTKLNGLLANEKDKGVIELRRQIEVVLSQIKD